MWCLSHKSQCSCKANTPRGALNACAPRRAGTNAAVRQVNDLEVSAAPPLAGFLAAKVNMFSGLLRPGLSDYEMFGGPEVLAKKHQPRRELNF